MMDSAAATFGYSSGSGGAAVSNFFAFTENWTQGLKVYSTRIEPPYPKWYFAEGYTGTWWDEYLTLANPNNFEIKVMVEYMLEGGGNPAPVEVTIPANNRVTVAVKDTVAANKNVSCRLTSSSNFIAERPMYFWYEEQIAGGDCVMGYIPPTK